MCISLLFLLLAAALATAAPPARIYYQMQPNRYLDEHARELKSLYDGFFFVAGNWDDTAQNLLGAAGRPAPRAAWVAEARRNLASLRRAGVTENFLGVSFAENGRWPSAETLLGEAARERMKTEFGALGRVARDLGFRGVAIDVEYPYKRYSLEHEIYRYDGYTAEDLCRAARAQGRTAAEALLDEFPAAVVLTLPGEMRVRAVGREFLLGFLGVMAARQAPGGFHLASEHTYCIADPLTTLAAARFEDAAVETYLDRAALAYWRRSCTIAPGVWPTHMIETGGPDYPLQPWSQEIAELREQWRLLRHAAKRYLWTYSGMPAWYAWTPGLEKEYGLTKQDVKRPDIDFRAWHDVLRDRGAPEPRWSGVLEAIARFDRGELSGEQLCDAFGVPARWWVLGLMGHPRRQPRFFAANAVEKPVNQTQIHHGRDGALRWFRFDPRDPRGLVNIAQVFDWRNTDAAAAHFVTAVHSARARKALLHLDWDDTVAIRIGGQVIFDTTGDERQVHGMLYRDKYRFARSLPIQLPAGRTRLAVTDVNSHGSWGFTLRITGEDGLPMPGVRFRPE